MDKDLAMNDYPILEDFCAVHDLKCVVSNHNAHWRIYKWPGLIAEWWPQKSKLVLERKYQDWVEADSVDEPVKALLSHSRRITPITR